MSLLHAWFALAALCEPHRFDFEFQRVASGAMLEAEERIQAALNEAGMVATQEALKRFDTDGSAIHETADAVGAIAQAKEEDWRYETPKLEGEIASVAIGMDGACLFLCEEG